MPAFRAAEDPSDALPHIDGNIFIRRRSERKLTPRITKMKSRGIKARARKADAKHLNKCRGIRRRETQSGSPTTASIAWTGVVHVCRSTCTRTLHLLASLRSPAGDVCSHTNQKTVSANAERQRASTGEKGET
jgi:hypothetical protein